jgi:Ca2+-binding EF-hand superfamily protein
MNVSAARLTVVLLCLGAVAPGIHAQQTRAEAYVARFQALDVNKDGVVSRYEYDSDVAFGIMDSNGDRRLSASELQEILGPTAPGVPTAAERIVVADLDADGELDENELRRATEMRFETMDRNQDGNLDLAEFASAFGVRAR